jgi:hypothetical protein
LKDVPALLELVTWKLTIITNYDENDIFDILGADDKTKCQVEMLLMVKKIVPKTADEYTSAYQSSWMCSQCIYMNDEEISPRLSLVILMKGHEYMLCAVLTDNTK